MGQNSKYTSEHFMQEIVLTLEEAVQEPVKEEIQPSPAFSLLIDETTYISILKQMIIYGCYMMKGELKRVVS